MPSDLVDGIWHAGELKMQEAVHGPQSEAYRQKMKIYMMRTFMNEQHIDFFENLPWIPIGTVDGSGQPWGSLLQRPNGAAGGLTVSTDGKSYSIPKEMFPSGDVAIANLSEEGAMIGMVGIELHTRRRNRLNGTVKGHRSDVVDFSVYKSFGNCPKYIQNRDISFNRLSGAPVVATEDGFSEDAKEIITSTDTIFLATTNPGEGIDMSHRGGNPGFLDITSDGTGFLIPDYPGNMAFSTFGNILQEPRVGILVIDWPKGRVIQLLGRGEVLMEERSQPGALRAIKVTVTKSVVTSNGMTVKFSDPPGLSPYNPRMDLKDRGEDAKLEEVTEETDDVATFSLSVKRPMIHKAGQYANFLLLDDEGNTVATRSWTLSSTPTEWVGGGHYFDITVKNKVGGVASPWLHDVLASGKGSIRVLGIEGIFTPPKNLATTSTDHFVFFAAGSGITPVMSILGYMAREYPATTATFVYSIKKPTDLIFKDRLGALVKEWSNLSVHVTATAQGAEADPKGAGPVRVTSTGRISTDLISRALVKERKYHTVYACGPGAFSDHVISAFKTVASAENTVVESFDF